MKLKTTSLASLFSAIAAFSISAQAAPDVDKTPEAQAPTPHMQADMAGQKKMRPHSHVEEKTGVPQSMPTARANQTDPTKDKNRHLHPRDGK